MSRESCTESWVIIPDNTLSEAKMSSEEQIKAGNKLVTKNIKEYCKGKFLPLHSRRVPKEWRGKHTWDLGFKMEERNVRKK